MLAVVRSGAFDLRSFLQCHPLKVTAMLRIEFCLVVPVCGFHLPSTGYYRQAKQMIMIVFQFRILIANSLSLSVLAWTLFSLPLNWMRDSFPVWDCVSVFVIYRYTLWHQLVSCLVLKWRHSGGRRRGTIAWRIEIDDLVLFFFKCWLVRTHKLDDFQILSSSLVITQFMPHTKWWWRSSIIEILGSPYN